MRQLSSCEKSLIIPFLSDLCFFSFLRKIKKLIFPTMTCGLGTIIALFIFSPSIIEYNMRMNRFFSHHRWEWYAMPLLISIFFLNYHYYNFYQADFSKITQAVSPSIRQDNYERIQQYHPYYQIYLLAKNIKNPEKNIIFIRTKTNALNAQYLHELTIMMNYYFYPHLLIPHSLNDFLPLKPRKNQIIISDFELALLNLENPKLKNIVMKKKDLARINRRKEDDFFVYQVIE